MFKNLKAQFEEAVKKNKEFHSTPHSSEELRAHNKKAGWAIFAVGLIFVAANLFTTFYLGFFSIYFALGAIFCIAGGLYEVTTGKLIKR